MNQLDWKYYEGRISVIKEMKKWLNKQLQDIDFDERIEQNIAKSGAKSSYIRTLRFLEVKERKMKNKVTQLLNG